MAALAGAFLAGAHPVALAVAGAAWITGYATNGLPRVLAFLAAPVALAASVPWTAANAVSVTGALAALAVLAGLVPFERALGPGRPPARAWGVMAAAAVAPVAFALTPAGAVIVASDLATGALVVVTAAGVLVAATATARDGRRDQA